MRKVPEVTIFFWIIKLLTTAMGESTSDYLVFHINPYIAVALAWDTSPRGSCLPSCLLSGPWPTGCSA